MPTTDQFCAPMAWDCCLQSGDAVDVSCGSDAASPSCPLPGRRSHGPTNPWAKRANCRHASDWAGRRLSLRSCFLRDSRVCFDYWVVEGPAGNGAHAIKTGEDA
jgi:hypothetical protein